MPKRHDGTHLRHRRRGDLGQFSSIVVEHALDQAARHSAPGLHFLTVVDRRTRSRRPSASSRTGVAGAQRDRRSDWSLRLHVRAGKVAESSRRSPPRRRAARRDRPVRHAPSASQAREDRRGDRRARALPRARRRARRGSAADLADVSGLRKSPRGDRRRALVLRAPPQRSGVDAACRSAVGSPARTSSGKRATSSSA